MPLRDYQQAAFDAAKDYLSKCYDPCVIEAATGAGKSHVIAALAEWMPGKVLCIAPSKELVEQNYGKFLATGSPASIYSASAGRKCLRHDVIFGTPKTILNGIEKFPTVSAVIVDECHGLTATLRKIIDALRQKNKVLRVVGLTATPYRTGEGYIYRLDENGLKVDQCKAPYFARLVFRITAHELIERGFLTPPTTESQAVHYDTAGLEQDRFGRFKPDQIERAFTGKERLTAEICRDIIARSHDRKGVVIFAASIAHAHEVMASLPVGAEMITGKTKKAERERIIAAFKAQRIKYLVNVAVLTTGFDAPHIDVVAILRATESPGLLQQIVGRGLRLHEGKTDCLVLDYAENIPRHCPDGDVFSPDLSVHNEAKDADLIDVECPTCRAVLPYKPRPNPDGYLVNKHGYFTDLRDEPVMVDIGNEQKRMPAHFGRRCKNETIKSGQHVQCDYRWTYKACPECDAENDIAARYCESCGAELVDPNEKLRLDFSSIKADPYTPTSDRVKAWAVNHHVSLAGNEGLRISFTTDQRTLVIFAMPKRQREWAMLSEAVFGQGRIAPDADSFIRHMSKGAMPRTITVSKDRNSGFYQAHAYNQEETTLENL